MGLAPRDSLEAAVVQMDVHLGDVPGNLSQVVDRLEKAASEGAELVVLPECCLSGYCFESAGEALPFAVACNGPELDRLCDVCTDRRVAAVIGFLEREGAQIFNSAALMTPSRHGTRRSVYRKTHLPTLGIDRFVARGKALQPEAALGATLATLVCYDIRFPEAARSLAVQGAEVLALPTNWPEGAESSPEFITRARAWENRVWLLAANRIGVERGRRFIGRSQIVSPDGEVVAEAGSDDEALLRWTLDLRPTRRKRIVIEPGAWELDPMGDRRPDLYSCLAEPVPGHRGIAKDCADD